MMPTGLPEGKSNFRVPAIGRMGFDVSLVRLAGDAEGFEVRDLGSLYLYIFRLVAGVVTHLLLPGFTSLFGTFGRCSGGCRRAMGSTMGAATGGQVVGYFWWCAI